MFMIALVFLALITFQVRSHSEEDRPPRTHQKSSTPTVEFPMEAFPVLVQMFTPQPKVHEITHPTPEPVDYYTGWPTNVWMYPVSKPSFQSSSPTLPTARPVPVPILVPTSFEEASNAPQEGITSKPSPDLSPLALSLPNTSFPSCFWSERPVPVENSFPPVNVDKPSTVPTNFTDSAALSMAPSYKPTEATEQPTLKQQASAVPTESQPTSSALPPLSTLLPTTRRPTRNTAPVTTPISAETERPSVAPSVTPEPITPTTTSPTAYIVNSMRPSATMSSTTPSACIQPSRPSTEETSNAPHVMASITQTGAPDAANGPKMPTLDPTVADTLLPSSLNSVSTMQPSPVAVNSVAPTVHTTACVPSLLPTVISSPPSRTPSTYSSTEKPSVTPTVSTTAVSSAIAGRSSAPSRVLPPASHPPTGSASPTLNGPVLTGSMLPTISCKPSTTTPTAPTSVPLSTTRSSMPIVAVPPSNSPSTEREPSCRPTRTPTLVSRSPTEALPSQKSPSNLILPPTVLFNTALPTHTTASAPPSPSQTSSATFLLLNISIKVVVANFTTALIELSRPEQKCVEDGVLATLMPLPVHLRGVHALSRHQEAVASFVAPSAVAWTLNVVITVNTTQSSMRSDISALQQAFNASLYSGMLQENTRAAARTAQPPVTSMIMVIFCAENDPNRCLATITPTQPVAGSAASTCKRDATEWNALYNTPVSVPWYLVWTILLLAAWLIVAGWATSHVHSRAVYVTSAGYAYGRVVYFTLLLAQYINHFPSSTRTSLACIEFAYLDTDNNEQFYLTWTTVLTRNLFYPLLLLQVSQLVRDYWNCRDMRDTLYGVFAVIAILGVLTLFVPYIVLFSTHEEQSTNSVNQQTAIDAVVGSGWILQLLCGVLLVLQGARLWLGSLLLTRARRLSDVYGDPHAVGEKSWKHSSVEAKSPYRDLHLSRVHNGHPQNAIAAESAFEKSPTAPMWAFTALLLLNAMLIIVTAIPQTLATAVTAFVLYSVLARVSEMLLVVAMLHKSISMGVYLKAQDDHADLPEISILSSTHDKDNPTNTITNKTAGLSSYTPVRKVPSFRSFASQRSENADKMHNNAAQKEAPPSLSDLSEPSFADRTIWNKKWPWVMTPNNDIAVHVAQQQHSVGAEVLHSPQQQQAVPGDSDSEDSTDSSGTYFV